MNRFRIPRLHWGINQTILAAAIYLAVFANLAFFRNLNATFGSMSWNAFHLGSLAVVLLCATILLLSAVSFRAVLKPLLTVLFMVSAIAAYFMDTYNVVIDRDMLVSALSTNTAESGDLLTPRLFAYLGLLGLLPSLLLWRIRLRPETAWQALGARLQLAGGALAAMLSLVLISSAFYSSFVREHKLLRYYANPLTPIYSAYKLGSSRLREKPGPLQVIGEDARIPAADIDRELVIMVVGETARADRFSLNGYKRKTNPQLERHDVVSFTQVEACGTSTAISVPCMFDVWDQEDFSSSKTASTQNVLDVLAHANVNVLWRDNNSDSKGVADRVPTEDFRSPEVNPVCDEECRDEGMLAGLQDYIDLQPAGDILIILHQMGSHGPAYYKRYPPKFRVFQPTCDSNQLDRCSEAEIGNTYDNTILYTDHFLSQVLELLQRNDPRFETAMLYAGDHGESLGEAGVFLHGLPSWIAPDAQTRVPMILWFGANYHDADPAAIRRLSHEPLSHDHIFHTLLGLFEIRSAVYDASKDILDLSRQLTGVPREYQ